MWTADTGRYVMDMQEKFKRVAYVITRLCLNKSRQNQVKAL